MEVVLKGLGVHVRHEVHVTRLTFRGCGIRRLVALLVHYESTFVCLVKLVLQFEYDFLLLSRSGRRVLLGLAALQRLLYLNQILQGIVFDCLIIDSNLSLCDLVLIWLFYQNLIFLLGVMRHILLALNNFNCSNF